MSPHIAYLLGALALLTACKTTPLDVVYATDVDAIADAGGAGGGGGGSGGAGSGGAGRGGADGQCAMGGTGSYVLRSRVNGLCLGQGAPTTVFGNPAFLLDFDMDCRHPESTWQLDATPIPNVFSLRNLAPPGFALDVQTAATRDGTPVITYVVTGFDNQRFEVRAHDAFSSELRPQHHPQSCLSASGDSAQIVTCDATDTNQAWWLQRSDCM